MTDPAIQSRKQRWLEFYDLPSSRRFIHIIRFSPDLPNRPLPNPDMEQKRIEWIWQNYEYHLERTSWLEDDTLPYLDMMTGTEIFAEAFGCTVYRPDDNYPFALPCVHSAEEAHKLHIPTLDSPPLARIFRMADELARRAGPGTLYRLVDLQSPLDVAALIWEKSDFYMAMIDAPQAVAELAEKVKTLQFAFLDEWFHRYGQECIAHYPDYYLPQGVTLSVDEIGAVNSKMFLKFFLPELIQFSERYGGLGMHCCAHARHQWEHFKKISGLRLLNIVNHTNMIHEAYPYFADFVCQWHSDPSLQLPDPLDCLKDVPVAAHIVLEKAAESKDHALRIAEQFRAYPKSLKG
jgi:hypothetical protein